MVTLTAPETSTEAAEAVVSTEEGTGSFSVDLAGSPVRDLNQALHNAVDGQSWTVTSPGGKHSLAVGINADVTVTVEGHAGYYAAGMHQKGDVTINGNAGVGLAENIMS